MNATDYQKSPITTRDVLMMQEILIDWCIHHGVEFESCECEEQARLLVAWFECGCCSETMLREVFLEPPPRRLH
jgi:hypothetical protein